MLTIAHADRSRPTLKDDERFRNGLVCDLTRDKYLAMKAKYLTMKAKLTMNILNTMLCVSMNCSNDVNRSTKNFDEAKLRVTVINPGDSTLHKRCMEILR